MAQPEIRYMSENGPIPDDSVRSYAAWGDAPARDLETGEEITDPEDIQGLIDHVRWLTRDLARELLALRAWARGACAWLECASTGACVELPPTNVPRTAAEGRALLPEPEPR